jgi:hypothetical protein
LSQCKQASKQAIMKNKTLASRDPGLCGDHLNLRSTTTGSAMINLTVH